MKISHVIRGEDHIANTPKQILLIEALGFSVPEYAHLPLILGPDRSKLSKRHGATSVDECRAEGYLPEALVNFMALLGWNPGDEREIFSKAELIREFSLEKVQKSGAVFDIKKLDWMNGEYIRRKSAAELTDLCRPHLTSYQLPVTGDYLEKIIALEQPRMKKLSEIGERADYFFGPPEYEKELLQWKSMTHTEVRAALERAEEILTGYRLPVTKESLEQIFFGAIGEGDRGALLWPLRVALTGKKASPGPFEIIEILVIEETLARIRAAKKKLAT
jgi:glutamyl/glutaminyl-tRNA synthetase